VATDTDVTYKTVLITGAGKRVGRALAETLGASGWSVGVHYNGSRSDAEDVVRTITASGGKAVALQADLADTAAAANLLPACVKALGPVGALINNASIFEKDDIHTATVESWDSHLAINLRAPFFLSQMFAKNLGANDRGAIINILDERVWNPTPHFSSYTVSKAGLWTLTQTMAQALAPNVRVNAVGPGPTLPNIHQTAEEFTAQCKSMPLGRGTTPAEIAAAVQFILAAGSMTGQMIALDGGQHLGWGVVAKGAAQEH
jgi:NAD(P)-dependent dehydrogenase (short-subunit alcohol dehydrogenase family)